MERVSYELYTRLAQRTRVDLVALRRQSLLHLAWFMPYAFFRALTALILRRVDSVFFSDGVVAFMAPGLKCFSRVPFVVTVHGLELTYKGPVAGALMRQGVRACHRVVAVSQHSAALVRQLGVPEKRVAVIYSGIAPLVLDKAEYAQRREAFEARHGVRFGHDRLVLALGRLVERKGIIPFIEKGVPLLAPDIKFIVAGIGPQGEPLRALAQTPQLRDRLIVLGAVSDADAAMLRQSADLFLLPNIRLANDVEGFGLAPAEALYAGTPVVAFAVDALVESIRQGGYLIKPDDYPAFVEQIHAFYRLSPAQQQAKANEARAYVRREYNWDQVTDHYLALFTDLREE